MAAIPSTEVDLVTISINEVELKVPKDELIVESVKRIGLEIPIFCYHPRMKPVGMCRMCLVEVGFRQPDGTVRKMPKPQAACTLPASEGMVVYTDSQVVHRDRRGVLEFLLVNHPLDCPICDRGGECPLQNNTIFYGPSTSRFVELKRHAPKAFPLSKYVTLDLERCIQCGRCVRFTEEISGDSNLAFRFRGADMQPSSFRLMEFESKFSGNVIEICPVGALTSTAYRFRARPWDLETKPAICTVCSNGCNVWFDYRVDRFVRINGRTNELINEEWTCDRGKFGHDFYNDAKRLTRPLLRRGNHFIEVGWPEAYAAILDAFSAGGNAVAGLAGPMLSNEDLFTFQELFRKHFSSNNIDHRRAWALPTFEDRISAKLHQSMIQTSIAEVERQPKILVFGTSIADELPIVFLRLRKAWFLRGAQVVVAHSTYTDADSFAHSILRFRPGTEGALAAALLAHLVESRKAQVPDPVRSWLQEASIEDRASECGVAAEVIRQTADWMGDGALILASHGLLNAADGNDTVTTLAAIAMCTGGKFNCYALGCNDQGATDLGVLPDTLPGGISLSNDGKVDAYAAATGFAVPREPGLGSQGILHGCTEGNIQALWLAGLGPEELSQIGDWRRALEKVPFLVVQAMSESDVMGYATVVLPLEGPAEHDGSYTNCDGTVQEMGAIISAPGDAKPAWRTYVECGLRKSPSTPYFNAEEIRAAIRKATSLE